MIRRQRGFIIDPYRFGGEACEYDPQVASVVLHLRGDGAEASTTIVDSSSYARSQVTNTGVNIDTAIKKFGAGSVDINLQTVTYADSAELDIGTADFTLDMWLYPRNVSGFKILAGKTTSSASADRWAVGMNAAALAWNTSAGFVLSGGTLVANTWQHVAAMRQSGTLKLYIGGAVVASGSFPADYTNAYVFTVGDGTGGAAADALVDELRFTPGVARYGSTYTVPILRYCSHEYNPP